MKVLVTGGRGFIGSYVVERLLARGDEVTLLGRFRGTHEGGIPPFSGSGLLKVVEGDVRDQQAVWRAASGTDATIHLAAIVGERRVRLDPEAAFSVNVGGTVNVLEAARRHGHRRFIYSSSVATYGEPVVLPIGEGNRQHPLGLYGATKLAGEALVGAYHSAYGLCVAALRFFNVYGPREKGGAEGVIHRFISDSMNGGVITLRGDGRETRDFVYVADVADAVVAALDSKEVGPFNVGSGKATSIRRLVEEFTRLRPGLRVAKIESGKNTIVSGEASIEKISSAMGWRPKVGLDEGLRLCLDELRSAEQPEGLREQAL